MLLGQDTRLPTFYRKIPGNITDVMTIEQILSGIDYLSLKKVLLVLDRGYYSESNVNELFRRHCKFVMGAKISLSFVQKLLADQRDDFDRHERFNAESELFISTQMIEWNYIETKSRTGSVVSGKRRMYVHIYYNDQHATDDKIRHNKMLNSMEDDIKSGKTLSFEREKACDKYYHITKTPVRGVKYTPKQPVIDEARKNFGFFVLLSNGEKDPVEALRIYRAKDMIEKAFLDLKDRLSLRRTSVASEENLEGKIFIQFVALIYLSYMKHAMDNAGLFKNNTVQSVLDDLDVIEMYQQPGKAAYYGEITDKQQQLYKALGVYSPS